MDEVQKIIEQALMDLHLNDSVLINRYTKEESINHWLAIYIDKHVKKIINKEFNVDVEYNRNVTDEFLDDNRRHNNKKIIKWSENFNVTQEIIPDIIVHKRRSNEHNYLCIEAKKEHKSKKSWNKDFQKIIGLLSEPYNYKYGCIIEYLPGYEYFEITLIRQQNQDYEIEQVYLTKPST